MRIIAVDDERLALAALEEAIHEAAPEAEVAAFQEARGAVDFLKENACDIAFLDIRLRGTSGLDLALQLKRVRPHINIIFVTGYDEYLMPAVRQRCSGYLLKPVQVNDVKDELENLRYPPMPSRSSIHAQTFGNFELFLEGKAVPFETARSKELLAFLIDRRGAAMTNSQIEAVIWEANRNVNSSQTQVRKAKAALIRSLEAAGIGHILRRTNRQIQVDISQLSCDYWQLLDNDVSVLNSFTGEYMMEYSWAESTRAMLSGKTL